MPDPVAKRLGYALKRAQHALRVRMDDVLRPLNLTAPQYAVLCAIEAETGISNARLARTAFVTPQTMQGILVNLERNGRLTRETDPTHGRVLRSRLTGLGQATLMQAHLRVQEIEDVMTASVGREQVSHLAGVLSRCADDLTSTTTL
ncbi:MarR family winged helix-turn-helix transcriptional regulator [uncultured Methylobacterium sp.]|uniref:MarR family winged helix-turn-helix transcriptional regulator n=1 Tax=uncultured Methylobacterium sp. TaxID=157278 RepID=UPI0035CA4578